MSTSGRCAWCEEVLPDQRYRYCSERCKKAKHRSEHPLKPKKRRTFLRDAVTSARRRPSADKNATGLHLGRDAVLMNPGSSHFYNPAYMIAGEIQKALDPDQVVSSRGEVTYQKDHCGREQDDEKMMAFSYRVVKAKTDKAMLFAINGHNVWIARSSFELLPGNIVKVKRSTAAAKGLIFRRRPAEF